MKDIFALKLDTRRALGQLFGGLPRVRPIAIPGVRIIADPKAELGARLMSRTIRAAVLTELGGEFLPRIEPILAALDEAKHSVRDGNDLRGLHRMTTAPALLGPCRSAVEPRARH